MRLTLTRKEAQVLLDALGQYDCEDGDKYNCWRQRSETADALLAKVGRLLGNAGDPFDADAPPTPREMIQAADDARAAAAPKPAGG